MNRSEEYAGLTRDALEARLKVAEDVCVLVGWNATGVGERGKALTQMWMIWAGMTGADTSPGGNAELNAMIPALAEQRDRTRAETLSRIRSA